MASARANRDITHMLARLCESVVRATMKVNGRGEIWPPATQKPLNRWSPKFVKVTTSGISTTKHNFVQNSLGVSVLRMRDFAPLKWLGYFFGYWERLQPRRVHRFWRKKYVKRRGSAQGSAFWGSRNRNLRFRPPFFRPKTALTLDGSRVNDP